MSFCKFSTKEIHFKNFILWRWTQVENDKHPIHLFTLNKSKDLEIFLIPRMKEPCF